MEMVERYTDYQSPETRYYPKHRMSPEIYRDMNLHDAEVMRDIDKENKHRMYYTEVPGMPDMKMGKSGMSRKHYMDSKEMHPTNSATDKQEKIKKLDTYMVDLKDDIMEMVSNMTPEEKQVIKQKMSMIENAI